MRKPLSIPSVARKGISRRQFLSGCAACAAYSSAFSLAGPSSLRSGPVQANLPKATEKPRVRLVFSHIPPDTPTWPNIGYDYEGRKKELAARLQKALPGIEFLPVTLQSAAEADALLKKDAEVDGYLIYLPSLHPEASRASATATTMAKAKSFM